MGPCKSTRALGYRRRCVSVTLAAAVELAVAHLVLACDPFHTGFDEIEEAELYEASSKTPVESDPSELRIMTWNIKFAGGRIAFFFECAGGRGWMSRAEVTGNLRRLAAKISQANPDILLIQEADTASKRCAYVDNVQWLLDHTHLNYGAYASQWRADYVPSDGVGRIDSGNAILSRWPLTRAQRLALPLIDEQDALTRYFYLRRNILRVKVAVGAAKPLWILNIHTSAFSDDGTKKKQLNRLVEEMDALAATDALVVGGGDLNTIPPGSSHHYGFADQCDSPGRFEGDDYRGEGEWLREFYERFVAAIPLSAYQRDSTAHHTFSGNEHVFWTRKLDYLFTNGSFVVGTALTHQSQQRGGMDTLPLSDHAPLSATLSLLP